MTSSHSFPFSLLASFIFRPPPSKKTPTWINLIILFAATILRDRWLPDPRKTKDYNHGKLLVKMAAFFDGFVATFEGQNCAQKWGGSVGFHDVLETFVIVGALRVGTDIQRMAKEGSLECIISIRRENFSEHQKSFFQPVTSTGFYGISGRPLNGRNVPGYSVVIFRLHFRVLCGINQFQNQFSKI